MIANGSTRWIGSATCCEGFVAAFLPTVLLLLVGPAPQGVALSLAPRPLPLLLFLLAAASAFPFDNNCAMMRSVVSATDGLGVRWPSHGKNKVSRAVASTPKLFDHSSPSLAPPFRSCIKIPKSNPPPPPYIVQMQVGLVRACA